jgi:hypothetical protein
VWNGSNSGAKSFLARDKFRKSFKDAIANGKSVSAAIKFATDGVGASSTVNGKTTGYNIQTDSEGDGPGQGATKLDDTPITAGSMDKRQFFRGQMRDALRSGKGFKDALRHATDQCDCRK